MSWYIHLQKGIKMQCKEMWAFLEVFISGKKLFPAPQPVLFSPKLCRLNCALLCDSTLPIMIAKDKKSEVFSYFKKVKGEFLARSHNHNISF